MPNPKLAPLYLAEAAHIADEAIRAEVVKMLEGAREEVAEAEASALASGEPGYADDAFDGVIENYLDDASPEFAREVEKVFALLHTNVREYFVALLGHSDTLVNDIGDCPLDSNCGESCARAINAAAMLREHSVFAHGEGSQALGITEVAANICNVYWRG